MIWKTVYSSELNQIELFAMTSLEFNPINMNVPRVMSPKTDPKIKVPFTKVAYNGFSNSKIAVVASVNKTTDPMVRIVLPTVEKQICAESLLNILVNLVSTSDSFFSKA